MKKYNQLSREQRYAIYLGLQAEMTKTAIARQIGYSISTVCREIKRNTNRFGHYLYKDAHEDAMMRRQRSASNRKTPQHIIKQAVNILVEEDWSPKQISGKLALEGINISHERIYQEIRNDSTGELKKHCRHKMKYRHHTNQKRNTAGKSLIPDRVSIHERPLEANGKRFGDWEMDLVIGKKQASAVLTIIERSTNMFFQTKVESKQPEVVAKAAYRLLLPYKEKVYTITTDNGLEFKNHKWLAKKLRTTVYFTDTYSSWQKGAVENANKIFRQYYPKGTDFNMIQQADLNAIQAKINRRPREKLNFSSPKVEFFKHFL